jgi:transcriptional regulator with XRE-family HTH domain
MVRVARRRSGLSQEEVAHRVGLHPTNLSKIERGHVAPGALLLLALMRELAIHPNALLPILGGKVANDRRVALEIEFATLAARLTDEGLALALEQLRPLVERLGGKSKRRRSGRSTGCQ